MADYDNINILYKNFTFYNGYFYTFSHVSDVIFQVAADSTMAFSYPLDTVLDNEVVSMEHDGINFWTLERDVDDGNADKVIYIKRWELDNYICKMQDHFTFFDDGVDHYDSDAFTVEHYHTTISGYTVSGTNTVYVNGDYTNELEPDMYVTLGPNSNGDSETKKVQNVYIDRITLVSGTSYSYANSDELQFYNNIWVFNNYYGIDDTTGALYKINAYDGSIVSKYEGGEYKNINASTFCNLDVFSEYGVVDTLCYVRATNVLFINVDTMNYYGSLVMDNISLSHEVFDVYDIVVDGENIYKLQNKVMFYGESSSWASHYNYKISPLHAFISSVALSTSPAVIPANQISTSNVTAVVRDQFGNPVSGRIVQFSHDDDDGIITVGSDSTDFEGIANTVYKSGVDARMVTITARVQQS